jgi:hypothetical protein
MKRKEYLLKSGFTLSALGVALLALNGIHLDGNALAAAGMLGSGLFFLALGFSKAPEMPGTTTRWWGNVPGESIIVSNAVLMPVFLGFLCFGILEIDSSSGRITIFSLSLLLTEALLIGALIRGKGYAERSGLGAAARLFNARAFSLVFVAYLSLGALIYWTPKPPKPHQAPLADFKALKGSLEDIKRDLSRDKE